MVLVMLPGRTRLAAQQFADRRQRENAAPRLRDDAPALVRLELELEERTEVGKTTHIRRIVIEHAPALFVVPCGSHRAAMAEHDLTADVMQALAAHRTSFQGTSACAGSEEGVPCRRVLHFVGTAEYGSRMDEREAQSAVAPEAARKLASGAARNR